MDVRRILANITRGAEPMPPAISVEALTVALSEMRPSLAKDLVTLLWVERWRPDVTLWEEFGEVDPVPDFSMATREYSDANLARRTYCQVAAVALAHMLDKGVRDRNGTRYRWAGAIIDEVRRNVGGQAKLSWRVCATGSRYTEFRDKALPVYDAVYRYVRLRESRAISQIRRSLLKTKSDNPKLFG